MFRRRVLPFLFVAVFSLVAGWLLAIRFAGNQEPTVEQLPSFGESLPVNYSAEELDAIALYELRNQSVVNINTETVTYNWFLEPVPREGSSGSGSVIDERGYVITNDHVVQGAIRVFVTLADGERIPGEVVGRDPENDLAVIRFDPGGRELTPIPFGSSSTLRIG